MFGIFFVLNIVNEFYDLTLFIHAVTHETYENKIKGKF